MSAILRIVYVSSATVAFSDAALAALLEQCRAANARVGVTGMLLHHDGNFLQLIEGAPDTVRELHARILRDPRHHRVITVLEEEDGSRLCPDWSMGFVPADRVPPQAVAAFTAFLLPGGDAARSEAMRGPLHDAIASFRASVR